MKYILLILLFLFISCGKSIDPIASSPRNRPIDPDFHGSFITTAGTHFELRDFFDKPIVLIFSSKYCSSCQEETRELVLEYDRIDHLNVISLVLGDRSDAVEWKRDFNISWIVGNDNGNKIFKRYCSEDMVPCIVIYKEKILFSESRKISVDEILEIVGDKNE